MTMQEHRKTLVTSYQIKLFAHHDHKYKTICTQVEKIWISIFSQIFLLILSQRILRLQNTFSPDYKSNICLL